MGKTSFDRKTRTGEPEQDKKALHQLKAVTGLWIRNARIRIMEDLLDHDPDPGGEKSLKMRQKNTNSNFFNNIKYCKNNETNILFPS